jgi:hypothetical protein
MKLRPYFFKRVLEDTHCDYGIAAESVEKCPIHQDIMIGSVACIDKSCCKGHSRFMHIVMKSGNWIECEETTKMKNENPLLGDRSTCVEGWKQK